MGFNRGTPGFNPDLGFTPGCGVFTLPVSKSRLENAWLGPG